MIESHELKRRDIYLNKLIGFRDTEPVKVVTGIRRCGKSSLLKLMIQHLKDTGVLPEQIIEMNFESFDFRGMGAEDIYGYVKERIVPKKRMYLFFDELQRIEAWEDAINAFRVDLDCDIYITGSNAYLLSSEYSTYLSGRCVEIKMLPLSFKEFLDFNGFEVRKTQSALGGFRKQVFDGNGERYELREAFDAYMQFGGMPGIADVGLEQEKALSLLDGIYSTVVVRDILEREKRRDRRQITDPALLRKIVLFLADNIGSNVSAASIGNTLVNEGLLDDGKRKVAPSAHTVQAYVNALLESYFFYEIKRFDIERGCNFTAAHARKSQGKNPPYYRSYFLINDNLVFLCWMHLVPVHGLAADELSLPLFIPLDAFDLLGDVLRIHIVHDGTEWSDVVGRGVHAGVNAVQQGDIPHPMFRKVPFHIVTGHDVITAQTRKVLGDDHIDLFGFNVADHPLEAGTVKAGTTPSIIHISIKDGQPVLLNKLPQQRFLVLNTLGWSFVFILL